VLIVAAARSSCNSCAISYVLPVLWMTSRLLGQANRKYTQSDSKGEQYRGRSVMSTIALFYAWFDTYVCISNLVIVRPETPLFLAHLESLPIHTSGYTRAWSSFCESDFEILCTCCGIWIKPVVKARRLGRVVSMYIRYCNAFEALTLIVDGA